MSDENDPFGTLTDYARTRFYGAGSGPLNTPKNAAEWIALQDEEKASAALKAPLKKNAADNSAYSGIDARHANGIVMWFIKGWFRWAWRISLIIIVTVIAWSVFHHQPTLGEKSRHGTAVPTTTAK
jgi:hypothetical protein